jgi:hypothetical protein
MAGGRVSRLAPLTNVWPKPLIPVNQKTILEDIMDRFVEVGCNEFYLPVNYKAEIIQQYFDNLNNPFYTITYILEEKPLGTAGSLYLLKDKIHSTFFSQLRYPDRGRLCLHIRIPQNPSKRNHHCGSHKKFPHSLWGYRNRKWWAVKVHTGKARTFF